LLFNSSVGLKIPGGAVEVSETYAESAARELEEELFGLLKKHFDLDTALITSKLENARFVELVAYKNKDITDIANDQIEFIHRDYHLHLNDMTTIENIDSAYQAFLKEFNFLAQTCSPIFGAIAKIVNSDAIKSGELTQVKQTLTSVIQNEYRRIASAFAAYYANENNVSIKAILPGLDGAFNKAYDVYSGFERA
ncbi:MAG: NUDIX domain-containing protein, partial [Gammaproteobacteria bacterium]